LHQVFDEADGEAGREKKRPKGTGLQATNIEIHYRNLKTRMTREAAATRSATPMMGTATPEKSETSKATLKPAGSVIMALKP